MIKCKVCNKRFKAIAQRRYEVIKEPAPLEALTKTATIFEAFDCPRCGCQNIVNVRETEINNCEEVNE